MEQSGQKLVTFDGLVNEQVHQLDRLRSLMGRLRVIRECVGGPVPEQKAGEGPRESEKRMCFLDRAMEVNAGICSELRDIEQEVAYLELVCGCSKPADHDDLGVRKARFDKELR
jgi:hypothetical protein